MAGAFAEKYFEGIYINLLASVLFVFYREASGSSG